MSYRLFLKFAQVALALGAAALVAYVVMTVYLKPKPATEGADVTLVISAEAPVEVGGRAQTVEIIDSKVGAASTPEASSAPAVAPSAAPMPIPSPAQEAPLTISAEAPAQ